MSLTDSTMMPLGKKAPEFSLPDTVSGQTLSFADVAGEKGTVVMFICNHCPYVLHIIDEIVAVANHYQPQGVGFVAISSNDVGERPEDGPEQMEVFAESREFAFPYLYDESQAVAKAYDAVCTPDFFVFDARASAPIAASSMNRDRRTGLRSPARNCARRSMRCSRAT